MSYPIDETQNKINPSGYSNINPFWANNGKSSGTELPPGTSGQFLSLKNSVIEQPTINDLEWKDIVVPDVDLSNYYTKQQIDEQDLVINENIKSNTNNIATLNNKVELKADTTYVNQQNELLAESTNNKLLNKADKTIVDNLSTQVETNKQNIQTNKNSIDNLSTQVETNKNSIDNLKNTVTTLASKQELQDEINSLTQTIDDEMAAINADIIPSKVILSESMKDGNSNKVYGFRRGTGTESDPFNQAVVINQSDSNVPIEIGQQFAHGIPRGINIISSTTSDSTKLYSHFINEDIPNLNDFHISNITKDDKTTGTPKNIKMKFNLEIDNFNTYKELILTRQTFNNETVYTYNGVLDARTLNTNVIRIISIIFYSSYSRLDIFTNNFNINSNYNALTRSNFTNIILENYDEPIISVYNSLIRLNNTFNNVNYIPTSITNFLLHVNITETVDDVVTTDVITVYMSREPDGKFYGNYSVVEPNHGTHIYSFIGEYVSSSGSYNLNLTTDVSSFNDNGTFGVFAVNSVEIMRVNIGSTSTVDLTNYYTKEETNTLVDNTQKGFKQVTPSGNIYSIVATYDEQEVTYKISGMYPFIEKNNVTYINPIYTGVTAQTFANYTIGLFIGNSENFTAGEYELVCTSLPVPCGSQTIWVASGSGLYIENILFSFRVKISYNTSNNSFNTDYTNCLCYNSSNEKRKYYAKLCLINILSGQIIQ